MSDIFVSYARSTATQARAVAGALRGLGYAVWLDDELPAHRAYTDVIEERLRAAKAVVVIWSAEGVKSHWVRAEASAALAAGTLVQLTVDGAPPPMPFSQIQCADMAGWTGDATASGWRKVVASIGELIGDQPAPAAPPPLPLPAKPSIAVLPFANLSGDPEQEYFADGMVEEIIRALSRYKSIFVIGSGSGLSFKGKATTPQEAAQMLGVRYVLEGSVRKAGPRVRIAVKLANGADGAQIWADRFEDTLEDVFALQDRVALSVAGIIQPAVNEAEIRRASARPTESMGSYDLCLRAVALYRTFAKADVLAALDLLDRAIALDPNHGMALSRALLCHFLILVNGWSDEPERYQFRAKDLAMRALKVGGDDPDVLLNLSIATPILGGDLDAAISLADRAMEINPGSSTVWFASGWARMQLGYPQLGYEQLETALRLDPLSQYRPTMLCGLGIARFAQGRFGEAAPLFKQCIQLRPEFSLAYMFLAASHGHLGEIAAAREAIARHGSLSAQAGPMGADWPDPVARQLLIEGIAIAQGEEPAARRGG